jgi:hypothetical protein
MDFLTLCSFFSRGKLNKIQMTNKYDSIRFFIDFASVISVEMWSNMLHEAASWGGSGWQGGLREEKNLVFDEIREGTVEEKEESSRNC